MPLSKHWRNPIALFADKYNDFDIKLTIKNLRYAQNYLFWFNALTYTYIRPFQAIYVVDTSTTNNSQESCFLNLI